MLNPEKMLKLTPISFLKNTSLFLDPQKVLGIIALQNKTIVIIDGPAKNSVFNVKESSEQIKKQLSNFLKINLD